MDKITTTIERKPLREIVAGRKPIEFREIKPYWISRLSKVNVPFQLRLINGMQQRAPEVTVMVTRIRKNSRTREYELTIGRIVNVKNWDRKREQPASTIAGTAEGGTSRIKLLRLTEFCVYTIVSIDTLRKDTKSRSEVMYTEKRPWKTAKKLWDSRTEGASMPVVLGDATNCSNLCYWGILTDIKLSDRGTTYKVDRLRKLNKLKPQDLTLKSTRKPIAPNFIKPYAICLTPNFLKNL